MTAFATTDSLYLRTPSVENLAYPPDFLTQDEAIEWCKVRVDGKSISNWELSWALSRLAPSDSDNGDEALSFVARELDIDLGSAGRMRWMGSVWTLDAVRRFDRLKHKHYEYGTRLIQKALLSNNHDLLERILDLYYQANEGEGNELDRTGFPRPWSASKLKRELKLQIEGAEPIPDEDKPPAIHGLFTHERMMDEDGEWHYVSAIIYPNEAAFRQAAEKLGIVLGQYVTTSIKLDESE